MPDMRKAAHFSSHIPLLMAALCTTTGDVLEMGTGYFSTPLIHWMCIPAGRHVLSLETDPRYIRLAQSFAGPLHDVELVADWDAANIEQPWDVAFIDHAPADRRRVDAIRLAYYARLIVIHDTNGRHNRIYHMDTVWPHFRYILHSTDFPQTSIVSNFIDPGVLC